MRLRGYFLKPTVVETRFGYKMLCKTSDFIQRRVFYFRIYEHNLTYYISQNVKKGDCVLDVGANVGYVSLLCSTLVGETGSVIAIEASPSTAAQLKNNIALNDARNITVLNVAATGGPCRVQIKEFDPKNIGAAYIVDSAGDGVADIEGDAVSNLIGDRKAAVNLIKIDIEGSEGPVLNDLAQNIESYPNLRSILVELREGNADYIRIFAQKGFAIFGMPNNYTISYYLIRNFLSGVGEGAFLTKAPVTEFSSAYSDYIFERK